MKEPKTVVHIKTCGIVMPISECDGRQASHWSDVLKIVQDAATSAGFTARLVSETMESNLIHKEILSNIYNDDIVIVDVSGRNPNVFFELGIRMATQKPTVIIKDDSTAYPFDTGPNRFIEYPRDLRHAQMESFKIQLADSLNKTINHAADASYIGQLGPFQIPKIEAKEIPVNDAILSKLDALERRMIVLSHPEPRRQVVEEVELSIGIKNFSATIRANGTASLLCHEIGLDQVKNGIDDFNKGEHGSRYKSSIRKLSPTMHEVEISFVRGNVRDVLTSLATAIDNALPF